MICPKSCADLGAEAGLEPGAPDSQPSVLSATPGWAHFLDRSTVFGEADVQGLFYFIFLKVPTSSYSC